MQSIIHNSPDLWREAFPRLNVLGHKYMRGHAIVQGGDVASTGAAKLAARAALRIGAGLVSVACTDGTLPIYAASFQSIMTKRANDVSAFEALILPEAVKAVLIGPGSGLSLATKERVLFSLLHRKATVLDADALTIFAENPSELWEAIQGPCVLTPHAGEFARLFGAVAEDDASRIAAAQKAAIQSNAVMVLKGAHTVIAAPNGAVVLNQHASPYLATAGSGDVLAGMIVGLLSQGMPEFEAACAAVWLHGDCALHLGAGLIAEDLPDALPAAFAQLGF